MVSMSSLRRIKPETPAAITKKIVTMVLSFSLSNILVPHSAMKEGTPHLTITNIAVSVPPSGIRYFAERLSRIELNSEYSDIIENSIYNLILASTSIDGKGFFYDNYLECNPGFLQFQNRRHGIRDEYHTCSCCPPNVLRLMASLDIYIYSSYKDQLVVNQFISSELDISNNKQGLKIKQISKFPSEGNSTIEILESNDSNSSIILECLFMIKISAASHESHGGRYGDIHIFL